MPREPLNGQAVTTHIHRKVLAVDEAEPPQLVEERDMMWGITGADNQRSHAINPPEFLPACRERPRRHTAEQRDESAAFHSITSSARSRIAVGNTIPSLLAVLRLMTSSNFVGNSAGTSPGFAPRNTFATI